MEWLAARSDQRGGLARVYTIGTQEGYQDPGFTTITRIAACLGVSDIALLELPIYDCNSTTAPINMLFVRAVLNRNKVSNSAWMRQLL